MNNKIAGACIALMTAVTISFADDAMPDQSIIERIRKHVQAADIYPHSEKCVRLYHWLEEQNYLVCDVDGELEYILMKKL